jgi:hypothetical protein
MKKFIVFLLFGLFFPVVSRAYVVQFQDNVQAMEHHFICAYWDDIGVVHSEWYIGSNLADSQAFLNNGGACALVDMSEHDYNDNIILSLFDGDYLPVNSYNLGKVIDDRMFQSVELDDQGNNFHVQNSYSYGDITECFLLIFIAGMLFWNLILKATSKKNDF